jgi:apolipoprotein N-acyltransferase
LAWGLAVLSGALLFLSFPKFGTPAAAWLALAPLLVAIRGARGRRAFALGLAAGLAANLGISLVIALFTAVFAWAASRVQSAWGNRALLLAPFLWVALEFLRSHTLLRFAWCLLGYSQATNLQFLQAARFGGVYAVSFLLVCGAAALAYAVVERGGGATRRVLLAFLLLVGLVYWDGRRQLAKPVAESGRVRVGLVQANIAQDVKWDPGHAVENLDKHVALTEQAVTKGARFVIWPESAVPGYYDDSRYLIERLGTLAAKSSAYVLFGNDDHEAAPGAERYYVGAKMLGRDGALRFRYHKINLVPFGEYVPFHAVLTLGGRITARLTQAVSDFTPGRERTLGDVDGHRFGAFICYEAIYPGLVSSFSAAGAELLVNITNDAWYGYTSAPYQHFEMASVRAVETGKYLVRAANTGVSAVVDPRGRVLARTRLFEPAALVHDVPFVRATTPYTRVGDLFAWGCVLVAAGALLSARGRRIQ